MSNYKCTAYHILDFWAMRSALLFREPSVSYDEFVADYSSELFSSAAEISVAAQSSSLAAQCLFEQPDVFGLRFLRSFKRGQVQV